jgi:hypothetical protein
MLAAVLLVLAPAAASAQAPTTAAVYGGATYQLGNRAHPVSAAYAINGQDRKLFVQYSGAVHCLSGDSYVLNAQILADVQPDGSFVSDDQTTGDQGDGTTAVFHDVASGTVSPTQVSGKFRRIMTIKDAQGHVTDSCDSQELPYNLSRARTQAGGTDQKDPVVLRFRKNGKPRLFLINWQCLSEANDFESISTRVTQIHAGPKHAMSSVGGTHYTVGDGIRVDVVWTLSGKTGAKKSNGTWSGRATVTDKSGKVLVKDCTSGKVPWQALGA